MSGEQLCESSKRRWTVMGVPIPQQFQLNTAKEEDFRGYENPAYSKKFGGPS